MHVSFSVLAFMALILVSTGTFAKDAIFNVSDGHINWSSGEISVTGYGAVKSGQEQTSLGKLQARRAAVVDAYRNLAEVVQGVRVTSVAAVSDMMLTSDVIKTAVNALIKGAKVVGEEFNDGIYKVKMTMVMHSRFVGAVYKPDKTEAQLDFHQGLLSRVVLSVLEFFIPPSYADIVKEKRIGIDNIEQYNYAKLVIDELKRNPSATVNEMAKEISLYEQNESVSGLVIDARAVTGFEMATVPHIRSSDGELLYPTEDTDYAEILKKRPVSYDFSVSDAVADKRVANHPIVVVSSGIYKSKHSDLIIPSDYATMVTRLNRTGAVNKAKVVIVVAE